MNLEYVDICCGLALGEMVRENRFPSESRYKRYGMSLGGW